jgi:hypothetical protein
MLQMTRIIYILNDITIRADHGQEYYHLITTLTKQSNGCWYFKVYTKDGSLDETIVVSEFIRNSNAYDILKRNKVKEVSVIKEYSTEDDDDIY